MNEKQQSKGLDTPESAFPKEVSGAISAVLSALSFGQEAVQGIWASLGSALRVAVVSYLWEESEVAIDRLAVMVPDLFAGFELVV